MGKAVTSPPEWRRRGAQAAQWLLVLERSKWPVQVVYALAANGVEVPDGAFPDASGLTEGAWQVLGLDRAGGDAGPIADMFAMAPPGPELASAALTGWACLETGRDTDTAAAFCRRFAWEQPEDVPGLLVVAAGDSLAPEPVVRAHAGPQDFSAPALGALFLARRFEVEGDFDDLEAAVELHDLTVALGDDVWAPDYVEVGWAAAVLYRITGEEAFLATAERMADVACEAQHPDGHWGSPSVTATAAAALAEMADVVESRQGVDEPVIIEPSGEMGG